MRMGEEIQNARASLTSSARSDAPDGRGLVTDSDRPLQFKTEPAKIISPTYGGAPPQFSRQSECCGLILLSEPHLFVYHPHVFVQLGAILLGAPQRGSPNPARRAPAVADEF
ncbi:hypothetical protein AOLI_G00138660 [Acnodon oligacanthus]